MPTRRMSSNQHKASQRMIPAVTFTGTAEEGAIGPSFGIVDIGASKSGYLFRVALPGIRCNRCNLKCNIERDGRVHIEGVVMESEFLKNSSKVFEMKEQGLCPPGPFSITFNLPGSVDPRLCSPSFRPDGILEVVVLKHRVPIISAEGMFEKWEESAVPQP
ncbi:hypothetical protein Leryth_002826 [Lithospermum erythrorhizon]|nr:hypothetical protein Leryth_002826 [Lithospermum erythrorhizon]